MFLFIFIYLIIFDQERNNFVRHTLADAIHNTACTSSVIIRNNVVEFAGDDGVAVVSYLDDKCLVTNITAYNNSVIMNTIITINDQFIN